MRRPIPRRTKFYKCTACNRRVKDPVKHRCKRFEIKKELAGLRALENRRTLKLQLIHLLTDPNVEIENMKSDFELVEIEPVDGFRNYLPGAQTITLMISKKEKKS